MMPSRRNALLGSAAIAATLTFAARDTRASGGVFTVEGDTTTQVTAHQLVLSVSDEQTSLWDNLSFTGDPADFAWVLPVKGEVEVAASAWYLFSVLDQTTPVVTDSPHIHCYCQDAECHMPVGIVQSEAESVGVFEHEVVGPYETVRLQATDAAELEAWLRDHGYAIPPDVGPTLEAYVAEGFDFLAMRLAPGEDVAAMRPVRVTMPGRTPTVPLRMLSAGTGPVVPVTLWVVGQTAYEPANMPSFSVDPAELVWDWDTQSSNYDALVEAGFDATGSGGWLVEATATADVSWLEVVALQSGFYPFPIEDAEAAARADYEALIGPATFTVEVTRMRSALPHEGLDRDLQLDVGSALPPLISGSAIGTEPACPPAPPSSQSSGFPDGSASASTGGGASAGGGADDGGSDDVEDGSSPPDTGGCSLSGHEAGRHGSAGASALLLVAGLAGRRSLRRRIARAMRRNG